MNRLLFLPNGHGEDLVAAKLIESLPKGCSAAVLPLSGEGKALEGARVLGVRKKFSSGGFSLRNLLYLPKDLKEGLLKHTLDQIGLLRKMKSEFDLAVCVGDIVPLIAALFTGLPLVFIGVNKSDHYRYFGYSYTPWEKLLLKRRAQKVFVRDKITADNLTRQGLPAEYAGNPLMDCLKPYKKKEKRHRIVGFLPGTRSRDARLNLEDFSRIAEWLLRFDRNMQFYAATTLDTPQNLVPKPFEETIFEADVVVGLSGTGNEQAAGIGRPVVSFAGRGSQYTKKFGKAQKQLLGYSLSLVPSDPRRVAEEVWEIIEDKGRHERMSKTGLSRMDGRGAVQKIAAYLGSCG